MNFAESCRYLLRLGHETTAIKLGLANTERLLELLGNPQHTYAKVQIAGTNGKGSTAAMLASICNAAGIRTGLYTSPHLVSITERIRCGEVEISDDEFARCATAVQECAEQVHAETGARPTFFEQTTAIALLFFSLNETELAVLETGLGGRLDATTAAEAETAVITPVGLDHQDYLGATLAAIATEKAAIIRRSCRAAITALQRDDVRAVLFNRARECEVDLCEVCGEIIAHEASEVGRLRATFRTERRAYKDVRLSLRGRHQAANALLAISTAEILCDQGWHITPEAIKRGLELAVHPGRLELLASSRLAPAILIDGAHNVDAAAALAAFLREFARDKSLTLVFGAMADKDVSAMAARLFPLARRLVLTVVDNPRSATLAELSAAVPSEIASSESVICAEDCRAAISEARRITPPGGLICVTGSLYLVGEVKRLLQIDEPHAT